MSHPEVEIGEEDTFCIPQGATIQGHYSFACDHRIQRKRLAWDQRVTQGTKALREAEGFDHSLGDKHVNHCFSANEL